VTTLVLDDAIHALLLVGDYGSGKTEVSVNLALQLATTRDNVAIADLDLVNPYFRCREAQEPLTRAGVRVVMPGEGHQFADLPILLPQVKGLLQDRSTLSVLDVGGDEAGSRVLASLAPARDPARHQFWFVVNARRPFCDTPAGVMEAIHRVERGAGTWRVSGLVSNTHLMQETTSEMLVEGLELSRQVGLELQVPVVLVAAMGELAPGQAGMGADVPLLRMQRMMVPPWIRRGDAAATRLGLTS